MTEDIHKAGNRNPLVNAQHAKIRTLETDVYKDQTDVEHVRANKRRESVEEARWMRKNV
jgi:hypothetical protein